MHTGILSVHETRYNNFDTATRWQIRDTGHYVDRGGGFQTQQRTQLWLIQPEIWGVRGSSALRSQAPLFSGPFSYPPGIVGNRYIDVQ